MKGMAVLFFFKVYYDTNRNMYKSRDSRTDGQTDIRTDGQTDLCIKVYIFSFSNVSMLLYGI